MDHYQNFTSLPPEEERTFVVYEQRTQETSTKALILGLISGGVFFAFIFMTVCVAYPNAGKNLMAGEDMGMLADDKERADTREKMEEAPAPATAPEGEAAPAPEAGEPAPDEDEPEGGDEAEGSEDESE